MKRRVQTKVQKQNEKEGSKQKGGGLGA